MTANLIAAGLALVAPTTGASGARWYEFNTRLDDIERELKK